MSSIKQIGSEITISENPFQTINTFTPELISKGLIICYLDNNTLRIRGLYSLNINLEIIKQFTKNIHQNEINNNTDEDIYQNEINKDNIDNNQSYTYTEYLRELFLVLEKDNLIYLTKDNLIEYIKQKKGIFIATINIIDLYIEVDNYIFPKIQVTLSNPKFCEEFLIMNWEKTQINQKASLIQINKLVKQKLN